MVKQSAPLRNEAGQTLEEFLAAYAPGDYERPSVTVDMALLTEEGELLLILRRNHPNIGTWALPGGFIEMKETLYDSALRELQEETGLEGVTMRSLGLFGEPSRDPRTRIVTAAFSAVLPRAALLPKLQAGDDAADARLFRWDIEKLGPLEIPAAQGVYPQMRLPCSATGEPYSARGQGYRLTLRATGENPETPPGADDVPDPAETLLSAWLALSDDGVPLLLASPDPDGPEDGAIAGDHALIIFTALIPVLNR